jgi:hypothetical protein
LLKRLNKEKFYNREKIWAIYRVRLDYVKIEGTHIKVLENTK